MVSAHWPQQPILIDEGAGMQKDTRTRVAQQSTLHTAHCSVYTVQGWTHTHTHAHIHKDTLCIQTGHSLLLPVAFHCAFYPNNNGKSELDKVTREERKSLNERRGKFDRLAIHGSYLHGHCYCSLLLLSSLRLFFSFLSSSPLFKSLLQELLLGHNEHWQRKGRPDTDSN